MLCWFLLYNSVSQLYIYIYPLPVEPPTPLCHPSLTKWGDLQGLSWAPLLSRSSLQMVLHHLTLSQLHAWKGSPCGKSGQTHHPRMVEGEEPPLPASTLRVNWWSCPLDDLLQHVSYSKHSQCHLYESKLLLFSVTHSGPTLCDPVDCSMPDFPVHHHFPEFVQTHVHWASDPI